MKKIGSIIISSLFLAFSFCSCNGEGEMGQSGSITGAWLKPQGKSSIIFFGDCNYFEFGNDGNVKGYCYSDKTRNSETGEWVDTIPHWDFFGMCRYEYDSKDAYLTIYSAFVHSFYLTWSDSKHAKLEEYWGNEYHFAGELVKTTKNNSISDYQALHKQ